MDPCGDRSGRTSANGGPRLCDAKSTETQDSGGGTRVAVPHPMLAREKRRVVGTLGVKLAGVGLCLLLPLSCGSGAQGSSGGDDAAHTTEAASATCPVSIKVPSQNEAVGESIQISVSQSCSNWTNAMIAYIDSVDCASSSYAYPNAGCHTTGGAQNFSTSTWVRVTPGKHSIVVNNWDSKGAVGVSSAVTFSYSPSKDAGGGSSDAGGTDPVFITAGDIGYPAPNGAAQSTGDLVRALLVSNPDAKVITLGDNAYGDSNDDQGSANSFATLYAPAWGSFIGITLPVPGNHDYGNWDLGACYMCEDGAGRVMSGYYAYFADKAITVGGTTATTLHYGYDFTTKGGEKWRYESLDSGFCFYTPSNCAVGSSEYEWLSGELASHLKKSKGGSYAGIVVGTHFDANESQECGGMNTQVDPMTELMYDYNVDLYLAGHVHNYERFCNLAKVRATTTQANCGTRTGPVCDAAGPMEINVGTGGAARASSDDPWAASMARYEVPGVLKVTLHDASWDFAFYNTSSLVLDSESGIATH
jgi:acid phosphatase type 7